MIKVTVFNEFSHEQTDEAVKAVYPNGLHAAIADFLGAEEDMEVRTVTLYGENMKLMPDCGITKELLSDTDVLLWWGHRAHKEVADDTAALVRDAVLEGMGVIFLHSAHHSKPFKLLMGTSCNLSWREDGDFERLWVIDPSHPIAEGIDRYIELEHEETYSEPFDIPTPDRLVFGSWYRGGEMFRGGCTFKRGHGNIFYFQPGHETYPTYYDKNVQRIIKNAVRWAKPNYRAALACPHIEKAEK